MNRRSCSTRVQAGRHEIVERPQGACRHERDAAFLVALVLVLAEFPVPVVGDLVVVPLRVHRHGRVERPQVLVQEVVGVVHAEFAQGLGHLLLLGDGEVAPGLAVRPGPGAAVLVARLGVDRPVGVDRVARVDEEVGLGLPHGLVDPHAAEVRIDPPALPGRVARPDEAHVALGRRWRDEAAAHRLAGPLEIRQVEKVDLVEDALARGQALQVELGREGAVLQRVDRRGAADLGHALGRRPAHPHPRRAVRGRPDHGPVAHDVADLHAVGHRQLRALGAHDGGRTDRAAGCRRRLEEKTTRHFWLGSDGHGDLR